MQPGGAPWTHSTIVRKQDSGPAPLAGTQFEPGRLVAGRYRIECLLGQGGMGSVFRAIDVGTGKPVALKTHRSAGTGGRWEWPCTSKTAFLN